MGLVIGVIPRFELAQQPDPTGEPDDRPSYTTPRDVTDPADETWLHPEISR